MILFDYVVLVKTIVGTVVLAVGMKTVMTILSWWKMRQANQKNTCGIPIPPKHLFWGHLKGLDPNHTFDSVRSWMRNVHDEMYQLWFGPGGILVNLSCHHHVTLQPILSTAEPKSDIYKFAKSWIGNGLISSEGKRWARDRRLLTPAFHYGILKQYVKIFNECTKQMLDKIEGEVVKNDPIELFEVISTMTLDTLLKCTFSVDSKDNVEQTEQYRRCVKRITTLIIKRLMQPLYYNDVIYSLTADGRQMKNDCDFVHQFAKNIIVKKHDEKTRLDAGVQTTKQPQENKHLDFLDLLLAAKDEGGCGMSDTEIQEQVDTFMFAGHDTTASAISFCLYNLGCYPEHQEKCRQEILELLDGGSNISWEDLSNLPYLTMCIKESMRVDPPVPELGRKIQNPLKIKDRIFDKGSWLTIAIFGVHHNPSIWKEPEEFNPLRFTAENTQHRSPFAFIPFSAGPRNCIGQHFAMNEIKVAVALTLARFRLEPVADRPCVRQSLVTTKAKNGVWIKLTPIT